jgi:hypothetical protein
MKGKLKEAYLSFGKSNGDSTFQYIDKIDYPLFD